MSEPPTPDRRDMTKLEKLRVRIETYGGFQLTKPESLALIECAEAVQAWRQAGYSIYVKELRDLQRATDELERLCDY